MTGATIFSGFGGSCLGMKAAGVDILWGLEYDDEVAQVARDNGLPTRTGDILDVDPHTLPTIDCLHMSPPCPNFSVAKTGASETEADLVLASRCASYVKALRPQVVTLENVWGYRNSESWAIIRRALTRTGYAWNAWHLCAADYGVPQTRKRMIVAALLGRPRPTQPPPTHAEEPPPPGLFGDTLPRWVGWYAAIEDLLDTLPETQFADWQLKRLPDEIKTMLVSSNSESNGKAQVRAKEQPVGTILNTAHKATPSALLVGTNTVNGGAPPQRNRHAPAPASRPNDDGRLRALLVNGQETAPSKSGERGDRALLTVDGVRRSYTVKANQHKGTGRALLVGAGGFDGKIVSQRGDRPSGTVTSNNNQSHQLRAIIRPCCRVVQMTPRALARFQSFPDSYVLPASKRLACKGIGNAVPPLLQQRLYEHLLSILQNARRAA